MTITNNFVLDDDTYIRDLAFLKGGVEDYARYISIMESVPFEEAYDFVSAEFKENGGFKLFNPRVTILDKNQYGDRELKVVNLLNFVGRVSKQNLLLSPSMTAYMQPEQRASTHAVYIGEAVGRRSKVKKEMFELEQAGIYDRAHMKQGEQNNLKINNNSYSGATVSEATILHYKSTHSSLTSTCRVATSYANAANEKFIRGNRHYYSFEIIKANFMSIINLTDMDSLKSTIDKFNLVYPETNDVMAMIVSNSEYYCGSDEELALITTLVSRMTPLQRAAVMYIGDLYHLYNLNKTIVRGFIEELARLGHQDGKEISDEDLSEVDGDTILLATFICYQEIRGRKIKDIKKDSPADYSVYKQTVANILEVTAKYHQLFKTFFLTSNLPSSIHNFPTIRRKAVPISDTDSTMFTLMWWIKEFFGDLDFSPHARRIAFAMIFMISEAVLHILAVLSRNMGIGDAKLHVLAMKNEYYFEVLCLTMRSKHYWASKDAQEGLIKRKPEMEIKGVGLRDSKVPPKIQRQARNLMEEIVNTIKSGNKIGMIGILTRIADIERSIMASLDEGKFEYLTSVQVKAVESYKSDDNATYRQYLQWNEVFGPSFGYIKAPPYQAVKLSLNISNQTALRSWIADMNNPELAQRLTDYCKREEKRDMNTLIIPYEVVEVTGIPRELTMAIDKRRIISNVMGAFYINLETLGIHLIEKNNIRLVSDYY